MTRLCVSLIGSTCREMARQIDAATAAGAEMIELRLDCLEAWDKASIRDLMLKARGFDGEIIVTCRLAEEGGNWRGDEGERLDLLELAGRTGADYIDVEYEVWRRSEAWRRRIGLLCELELANPNPRRRLILSRHDFDGTPADLERFIGEPAREPAHVVKVACRATAITDALRMLDVLRSVAAARPVIALAMGEDGLPTRLLAGKFGALLTFVSVQAGRESAPGQPTIEQARELYRWDAIGPDTRLFGVIGCPVAHSMSPAVMNGAFGEIGFDATYLPFRVEPEYDAFAAFLDGCLDRPWLGLGGCSVTIPHKENLLRYVKERGGDIEPLAARIGAANTLVIEPEPAADAAPARLPGPDARENADRPPPRARWRLAARNTDYLGARDALCAGMDIDASALAGRSTAVLGAGGAARAIVAGLRDAGCRVAVYNRTHAKAVALAEAFDAEARPWSERVRLDAEIVINCTSIGMSPDVDRTPLPAEAMAPGLVVFDTVYNPVETRLLREARDRGCRTVDGVAMFVNQAAAQFACWTRQPPPHDLMKTVVLRQLAR